VLSEEEAAQALDVSLATAERYWTFARSWLYAELAWRSNYSSQLCRPSFFKKARTCVSPVARIAIALATEVDVSGGEWASRQSCAYRSPRDRDEIRDLGGAAPGQSDARPTMPVVADNGDRYGGRLNEWR
jgi:hypothetical protein